MFKGVYDFDLDEEATVREFRDLPAGIHFPDVLNRIFRHFERTVLVLAGLANAGLPADHPLDGREGATGYALFSLFAGRGECGYAGGAGMWALGH